MENELEVTTHQSTMERLEKAKKKTSDGTEYWMARDLQGILGYESWAKFQPAITRARSAMARQGLDPSHHVVHVDKMMGRGGGALTKGTDFFVSRGASYLIAMNGDPSKAAVGEAQGYFAAQTRKMELEEQLAVDRKRLDARDRVTKSFQRVSKVAAGAGVKTTRQAVFHAARFQGLYGMSKTDISRKKGLKDNETIFDRAAPLELSMHEFQMNLAADVIEQERIRNEDAAIYRNEEVAREVRDAVVKSKGRLPEALPLAEESIADVRKRVDREERLATQPLLTHADLPEARKPKNTG